MSGENSSETYVRDLLKSRFGTEMRRIEETNDKTPDYEIRVEGQRAAVLEIKTIEPQPISEATGWVREGQHRWKRERNDNSPGRVAQKIHDAVKQLKRYECPRVLVLLNDETMDVHDLEEACNGYLIYGTPETGYIKNALWAKKDVVKRISEEKELIDLYIWIDRFDGRRIVTIATGETRTPGEVFFRVMTPAGEDIACRCFGQSTETAPTGLFKPV